MARGGEGYDEIVGALLYSFITCGLFEKQDLVLTFWIVSQNVEKHAKKIFLENKC